MVKVKNFDKWIIDKDESKYGSGASDKIWLNNLEDGSSGMFKYPKVKNNKKITGEY